MPHAKDPAGANSADAAPAPADGLARQYLDLWERNLVLIARHGLIRRPDRPLPAQSGESDD